MSHWIRNYNRTNLIDDVRESVEVAIWQLPIALAMSTLCGLAAVDVLKSVICAYVIHALWARSLNGFIVQGPELYTSMLLSEALGSPEGYPVTAILTNVSIQCGILMVIIAVNGWSVLRNALSKTVLQGFRLGLGVKVLASASMIAFELNDGYREHAKDSDLYHGSVSGRLLFLKQNVEMIKSEVWYLQVCAIAMLGLLAFVRFALKEKWPFVGKLKFDYLVVVVGSSFLCYYFKWNVNTLGNLSGGQGLISLGSLRGSFDASIIITVVGVLEMFEYPERLPVQSFLTQEKTVNKQIGFTGLTNIACSIFGSMPVFCKLVNAETRKVTPLAGIFISVIFSIVWKYCLSWVNCIPQCTLGLLLIVISLQQMFSSFKKNLMIFWKLRCFKEAMCFTIVVAITLIRTPHMGLTIGGLLSIVPLLKKTQYADITVLGKNKTTNQFTPLPLEDKETEHVTSFERIIIVEMCKTLSFSKINDFSCKLLKYGQYGPLFTPSPSPISDDFLLPLQTVDQNVSLKYVIFDMEKVQMLDISGLECLKEIVEFYCKCGMFVFFTIPTKNESVLATLERSGIHHAPRELLKLWINRNVDLSPDFTKMLHKNCFDSIENIIELIDYIEYIDSNIDVPV